MDALRSELNLLKTELRRIAQSNPTRGISPQEVDAFINSILRKISFACMHQTLIAGINWDQVPQLGRRSSQCAVLEVPLMEATLRIEHSESLTDYVYLSLDGLVAALANMSDTLARLINQVYALGVPDRQASILAVRDRCTRTSPLGMVLYSPIHMDWLVKIRDLRGRCQHADLEEILLVASGSYGNRHAEPSVPRDYSWRSAPTDLLITNFALESMQEAERAFIAMAQSIRTNPIDPLH